VATASAVVATLAFVALVAEELVASRGPSVPPQSEPPRREGVTIESLRSGHGKKRLTPRGVEKLREREASAGLDPADDAAQWLAEHDPPPPPKPPKSAKKSVTLHRFRQRKDRA
jgi:hypothetical protein